MISVIIPVYQRKELLLRALGSVLEQKGVAMEIVIVDDGSTDGLQEWLVSYLAKLNTNLVPEGGIHPYFIEHGGVSRARNFGVRQASGEWLAFLDSDDLWHPRKLLRQWEFHRDHPEISLSQTEEIWIRHGRRVNPRNKHKKRAGDLFEQSLELCAITPSSVLMKREVFERYGPFDESLPACEDYDLWLRIAAKEQVGLVEEALMTRFGGHEDQLSAKYPAMDRFRLVALAKILASGELSEPQERMAREVFEFKVHVLALGAAKRGRDLSGLKEAWITADPLGLCRRLLLEEWGD